MNKHNPIPRIDAGEMSPYVECGYELIPLHRADAVSTWKGKQRKDGKRPLHDNWTKRAYDSATTIEECVAARRNVGVRLTAEQLVIDVDPRNGGDESFDKLCAALDLKRGEWPRVETGSGGSHYYLRKPAVVPVMNELPEEYPGVEFKSAGRQVVAAGSVHPDTMRHYAWDFTAPLEDAPQVPDPLLELIRRPDRAASASGGGEHTPEQIASMLEALDPVDFRDYDRWLRLMMACHHASNGAAEEEFLDWSEGDEEYADDRDENARKWEGLDEGRDRAVTRLTLYKFLNDAGRGDAIPRVSVGPSPEDVLERMNRRYCKVTHGNRVRIMYLQDDKDDSGRRYWVALSKADFEFKLSHQFVERPDRRDPSKTVQTPLAKAWLSWRRHARANGVKFDSGAEPGAVVEHNTEEDGGWLNLWMGWGVEPRAGDWSLLREMIREVLCRGQRDRYDYLIRWLAWKVQNPGEPPEVTVALLGAKGSGKTTLGNEVIAPIFGSHGVVVVSNHQLAGRFSGHMANALFVFADEATWGGDREVDSALKQLITDKHRMSESKGKDAFVMRNRVGLLMAANPGWSIPAGVEDRRFLCLDVSDHRVAPQSAPPDHPNRLYWNALYGELEEGGRAAFLHDLLAMDLGTWHPRDSVPKTEAQGQQALEGLRDYERFWFEKLRDGSEAFHEPVDAGPSQANDDIFGEATTSIPSWAESAVTVSPAGMVHECVFWAERAKRKFNVSPKGLLNALRPFGVTTGKANGQRAWTIPKLSEARRLFAERLGHDPFEADPDA